MPRKKLVHRPGPTIGLDENGLGPRLGPMVVTAASAQLSEDGAAKMGRKLPQSIRADLDDSKVLVSCHDASLGEAWARGVVERTQNKTPTTPTELLQALYLESEAEQRRECPSSTEAQCWGVAHESFTASEEQLSRVGRHLDALEKRGISVTGAKSEIVCTGRLNRLKGQGIHRFAADLHCMERLILAFREEARKPIVATCGKVGGIGKYEPFFGPLAGRLHTALEEGQARSVYHFPTLGELRFVRDADAIDPLVMLASLIGKYVREILMGRVAKYYEAELEDPEIKPSGYHDPVTSEFVRQTEKARKRLKIVGDCFERRPADKPVARA